MLDLRELVINHLHVFRKVCRLVHGVLGDHSRIHNDPLRRGLKRGGSKSEEAGGEFARFHEFIDEHASLVEVQLEFPGSTPDAVF